MGLVGGGRKAFRRRAASVTAACVAALGVAAIAAPTAWAQGTGEAAKAVHDGRRPKLVVVISIDQFRADYLRRLADLYLPAEQGGKVGGFRYLMTAGSDFLDARYQHFPLYTGPGHAVILSGSHPYKNGIVGNDWWDRARKQVVYCVDDPAQKTVGAVPGGDADRHPMGPANMRTTTVGDELKLATAGRARVVTLSFKDRAAILLGGHTQDVCLWYDADGGRWVSSTAYCKDGKLPAWVDALNAEAIPDRSLGKAWTPVVGADALASHSFRTTLPPNANPGGIGAAFPHTVPAQKGRTAYGAFTYTPFGNAFIFESARRAVVAEKLGQRDTPDVLAFNLATNDYVGHGFGPYSPESVDLAVQTDRQLSDFLNFLKETVPGGLKNVVVALTADHGVAPVPEDLAPRNLPGGRYQPRQIPEAVQKALAARFGEDTWISTSADGKQNGGFVENFVYLSDEAISRALAGAKARSRAEIEQAAADAVTALNLPGVYAVFTRSQVLNRALPDNDLGVHLANGIHPRLTGDLVVINEPEYLAGGGGTSHGTAFAYDTHVPLVLCGFGIAPGAWADPVTPADLAPTLCTLLGIEFPSGCDGRILKPALK